MSFIIKSVIDQRTTLTTQPGDLQPSVVWKSVLDTLADAASSTMVTFDAVVQESHEHRNLITENPIEDGTLIADHKTVLPFVLNISGVLTDTPIAKNIPLYGALNSSEGRARKLMDEIVKIDAEGVLFTIVTGIKAYKNLLFEELTPQRSSEDSAVRFQAKCKQVLVVDASGKFLKNVSSDVTHTAFGIIGQGVATPF
jgi:Dit-like tail protein